MFLRTFAWHMKKYKIEVTEILSRTIETESDNEVNAIEKVRKRYRNCEIILDASDYVKTEFSAKDEKESGRERIVDRFS